MNVAGHLAYQGRRLSTHDGASGLPGQTTNNIYKAAHGAHGTVSNFSPKPNASCVSLHRQDHRGDAVTLDGIRPKPRRRNIWSLEITQHLR